MRLMSFSIKAGQEPGTPRIGVVQGESVRDLTARWADMGALLADDPSGADVAAAAGEATALGDVTFLTPTHGCGRIFCVGLNYRKHVEESGRELGQYPSVFLRLPSAQVGHLEPVVRPSISDMFDYEGELAVVIGKRGRHVAASDAPTHVAGYTCFAENSVRDWQRHGAQVTGGKNFDSSGAIGPWLTTADEAGDPSAMTLVTRLNGEEVQRDGVANLVFPIGALIAYISSFATLLPGDLICTGTPHGVGMAREPKLWLKPGDRLEVEISGVGTLVNRVVAEAAP